MPDKTYTTFIDTAGRTLFGSVHAETDNKLTVCNPVMITVQQQDNGQMAVQLFPLFFAEFVVEDSDKKRYNYFTYDKSSIALGTNFAIEPRIIEQYEKVTNPVLVPNEQPAPPAGDTDPEVVKLFDE